MSTYSHQRKFGQNFLQSQEIAGLIVDAVHYESSDAIIEIGPGEGVLTFRCAPRVKNLIAIEKDRFLAESLRKEIKKRNIKNCILVEGDARDISFTEHAKGNPYSLIGNIPYYLTSYIFRKIFEKEWVLPQEIIFMIQKEVAERIVAKEPRHSLLSVSIQAFGIPRIIANVSREHFLPSPKVDSSILSVSDISREQFLKHNISHNNFFTVLRAGFSHPRKFLIRNLAHSLKRSIEELSEFFSELCLNEKARASELSVEQWFLFAKKLSSNPK
ncbi:MAG: 16S rRNA (adenine(1518)-N(6)/adenine(1519)-N(6))-dimethyltransferase RsmA [Patescibacteria group bacterium]